jgi:hypothetical protein
VTIDRAALLAGLAIIHNDQEFNATKVPWYSLMIQSASAAA